MQSPFIPEDQIDAEKRRYAEALRGYKLANPFASKDDAHFKAALLIWPEDSGKLPVALWAVHSARWFEDEDVLSYVEEMDDEARAEAKEAEDEKNAYYKTPEFKEELKRKGSKAMLQIMENPAYEAKDRIAAFDRLSKSFNLDEKPPKEEAPVMPWLGIITMPVHEISPEEFKVKARDQQLKLQASVQQDIIELEAVDVRAVH